MGSWGVRGACSPVYATAYKGGSVGLAPGLGHGVQRGVRGACPPGLGHGVQGGSGGLAPRFRPPVLGINSFCDRFSYVFCGFSCISQPIYPTQNPLFPNRSL